ncbi:MAG: hypothetical protein V1909_03840 [Candidatus Micrarchaeota archaeon]
MNLEQAFATTSKVLFGEEIGKLDDYKDYLHEMMSPYQMKKSFVSGKDVMISNQYYPKNAKFVSQDEMVRLKFPPLNPNEIKDIDSLFSAVEERIAYCGNKLFGQNYEVNEVDNCVDCNNIFHAHNVREVKYGAYLSYLRESEYVFGVWGFPNSRTGMRLSEGVGSTRCFESHYSSDISDMYYAFNCIGCQNGIFAFNLRSKRNVIGNLELPKDEFLELKKKLVSEMADELKRKKTIFSILDVAFFGRDKNVIPEEERAYDSPVPERIETAFSTTAKLVLGKEHVGIKKFGPWLLEKSVKVNKIKGAFGSPTYKVQELPIAKDIPGDRLITLDEAFESAKKTIDLSENERPTLKELLAKVSKIAYFTEEFVSGQNESCIDTPSLFGGSNIYKCWDTTGGSKNCAYSGGVIRSDYIFGGGLRILDCQFCINCFDSSKLKGCFEVDSSFNTKNSYFCHNVENADNCMFCFNEKGLKYAIGNTTVGREEFERIKKILLEYLNKELGSKKETEASIFAIPKSEKKK